MLTLVVPVSSAADKDYENSTYIIGHWNYPANSVNPIHVVSEGEDVELFINGISTGHGRRENKHLFTFDNIIFQPGTLTAVSYDAEGKELGRHSLITSGVPAQLKLTVLKPEKTDGSEEALLQCEITDFYGKRCLHDNRKVLIEIEEPSEWGNLPSQNQEPNIYKKQLSLYKGENCIPVKKPSKTGEIKITVTAPGLAPAKVNLISK